ncbi:MAG TPA: hypothetical protein VFZ61_18025, partial [Polyangiales bacterium]
MRWAGWAQFAAFATFLAAFGLPMWLKVDQLKSKANELTQHVNAVGQTVEALKGLSTDVGLAQVEIRGALATLRDAGLHAAGAQMTESAARVV